MENVIVEPPYNALLLEGVNPSARELLEAQGCHVEMFPKALEESELIEKIKDVHFLGIRSKTHVNKRVLAAAPKLVAIGCFCIGTNQVDLEAATNKGVAVFNSPFANTRSVAELVMGEIICLARKVTVRSNEVHDGIWNKTHIGCYEIRGKTIGIIGYGHIGSQVGVLAESFGMNVVFYDVAPRLSLGNARKFSNMDDLITASDFVTLHVPETPETIGFFGQKQISLMKKGSYLLNLSRGTVVDLDALAAALKEEKIGGAAVDVYPIEPAAAGERHVTPLQGIPNVILTPHVGGSTVEAQTAIGNEVGAAFANFIMTGSTAGAVNFPEIAPPPVRKLTTRITNVHLNVPGALNEINKIAADLNCNIELQFLATKESIGYLVMDVNKSAAVGLRDAMAVLEWSMRTIIIES